MICSPLFALHDSDETLRRTHGAREVSQAEAERLNAEGYGVFWVPNRFEGRRVQANLKEIRYWFAEIDSGTKAEQLARLRKSPLIPSMVVESRRGYHAFWKVRGQASPEHWKRIERGLVRVLKGDPKATDLLRLLRAPGFNHVKDPANPFLVQVVWTLDAAYSEEQMLRAFPSTQPAKPSSPSQVEGDGFWSKVANLDARDALVRLNGHWLMKGESFALEEQPNGNANVVRSDGVDTGCFVDRDGRMGNVASGSSVAAWLSWYGSDWATIAKGLKEVFTELGEHA